MRSLEEPSVLPELPDLSRAKGRLFAEAVRQFGERGFYGVSIRDLASALGQHSGAVYGHVESKQDLLFQLLLIGHQEHRSRLQAALLETGSSPQEQICALARAHVLVHLQMQPLSRMANRELSALTEEQRARILSVRADAERLLLDVIERGVRLGAFDVDEPVLAVAAIGAMGIRAAEWWNDNLSWSAERVADVYATFALRILMATTGSTACP